MRRKIEKSILVCSYISYIKTMAAILLFDKGESVKIGH